MLLLVDSPIGPLGVKLDGDVVVGVRFGATYGSAEAHPVADELKAFFAGTLTDFTVPFELRGGSEFERTVWAQIAAIPYGEMITYGAIAKALGEPGAARAVGTACN